MSKDMTVQCDNGLINIRVGAIILKDGKFLMVGNHIRPEYLYSVGGRIKEVKHFTTDERKTNY